MPWLSSEDWWRNPRSKSWLRFAQQQHLQLTCSHSRKSVTPGEPAKQTSISPPKLLQAMLPTLLLFHGEKEISKYVGFGFFPKCNQCPWWCLFIPVCSIKACEEILYKERACMNKYYSEMRRITRKRIQTNFIFRYAWFLSMTIDNKNYIWGHGNLLFLLFVEALYKRRLKRGKCCCCWGDSQLSGASQHRMLCPATNIKRLNHNIFPAPLSLPLSWLSSVNQHHPLLSSLLPCTARNQTETSSPLAEGLSSYTFNVSVCETGVLCLIIVGSDFLVFGHIIL